MHAFCMPHALQLGHRFTLYLCNKASVCTRNEFTPCVGAASTDELGPAAAACLFEGFLARLGALLFDARAGAAAYSSSSSPPVVPEEEAEMSTTIANCEFVNRGPSSEQLQPDTTPSRRSSMPICDRYTPERLQFSGVVPTASLSAKAPSPSLPSAPGTAAAAAPAIAAQRLRCASAPARRAPLSARMAVQSSA